MGRLYDRIRRAEESRGHASGSEQATRSQPARNRYAEDLTSLQKKLDALEERLSEEIVQGDQQLLERIQGLLRTLERQLTTRLASSVDDAAERAAQTQRRIQTLLAIALGTLCLILLRI